MRLKKTLIIVGVVAVALALLGALLKDYATRKILLHLANAAGRAAGGFEVTVDRLHVGLVSPTFEANGIRVLNPTNYPVRECVEMKRLFIRRGSLWGGGAEIPEIDIDLTRLVVIRRRDGQVNVEKLASSQVELGEKTATPDVPASMPAAGLPVANSVTSDPGAVAVSASKPTRTAKTPFVIRKLRVKVDRLDYYDYSMGSEPMVIPAQLAFDQTFENVTDIEDLAGQLQSQLMLGDLMGGTNGFTRSRRSEGGRSVDKQIEEVIRGL